jgi:phosphoadenosine phosphosulfate reductase
MSNSPSPATPAVAPQLNVISPENSSPVEQPWQTPERPRATQELLAELREASAKLESSSPQEILAWAVERYAPRFTMATAFGPEGMTILHMLSEIAPETPVFNLDTGYQFQETLDLRDKVTQRYGMEVKLIQPEHTVEQYEQLHGGPLYKSNPTQCCFDRKMARTCRRMGARQRCSSRTYQSMWTRGNERASLR